MRLNRVTRHRWTINRNKSLQAANMRRTGPRWRAIALLHVCRCFGWAAIVPPSQQPSRLQKRVLLPVQDQHLLFKMWAATLVGPSGVKARLNKTAAKAHGKTIFFLITLFKTFKSFSTLLSPWSLRKMNIPFFFFFNLVAQHQLRGKLQICHFWFTTGAVLTWTVHCMCTDAHAWNGSSSPLFGSGEHPNAPSKQSHLLP